MFRFEDSRGREIRLTPRTIVVKVGSNTLCEPDSRRLDPDWMDRLAGALCALLDKGVGVVLVSSGAIAAGMGRLGIDAPSRSIPENQAYAAIGQSWLMRVYNEVFEKRGRRVAQILLTRADLEDRRRYLNARRAVEALLAMGVTPIVNENDTTVVEEIKFGGNDILSAIVATKLKADFLILLTNVDGVYEENPATNPEARLIPLVERAGDLDGQILTNGASPLGTGGMSSKIEAARLATDGGVYAVIANGRGEGVLDRLVAGRLSGTVFIARRDRRQTGWAQWILAARRDRSRRLVVDDGARRALISGKKSLLPAGVRRVDGEFAQGEVVDVVDAAGAVLARGVVNYSSDEIDRIKGRKSADIEGILGYRVDDTVVHRDNLVVIE